MFIGLQLFPYDLVDEGVETVLERAALAKTTVLLPAVNYISEDQPVPAGVGTLPHNPRRRRHVTDGGLYFTPRSKAYPPSLIPPESEETDGGEAALCALCAAAPADGIEVVPWLSLLNGKVADAVGPASVVNVEGRPVRGWLCPNAPETAAYVEGLVEDTVAVTDSRAVFIDRIRFPEWGSGGLADGCSCFCDHCTAAATAAGVDVAAVRRALTGLTATVAADPAGAVERFSGSALAATRLLAARQALLPWMAFRHRAVERLVSAVRGQLDRLGVRLWLDVWPPSYGWLLGQDLTQLARYADWVKPFTYHRLAGGADIAGFIGSLSDRAPVKQALYRAFLAFFGFPGPEQFEQFRDVGLDPQFVGDETRLAKRQLGGASKLAGGLQLWRVGPDGAREAIDEALAAGADGLMFFCYGWATLEELTAVGDAVAAA